MLRIAPAGLALLSVVLAATGLPGAALGALLAAVPLAAAVALLAVADVVDHGRSRVSVVPAAASLLLIVLAAASRRPEVALGCVVCLGLGWVVASADRATRKRSALSAARTRAATSR